MNDPERKTINKMLAASIDKDYPSFKVLFDELMTEALERAIQKRAGDLGFFFEPGMTFEDNEGETNALFDLKKL